MHLKGIIAVDRSFLTIALHVGSAPLIIAIQWLPSLHAKNFGASTFSLMALFFDRIELVVKVTFLENFTSSKAAG